VEWNGRADELDAGRDQPVHEGEDVVARHAERVPEAGARRIDGDCSV